MFHQPVSCSSSRYQTRCRVRAPITAEAGTIPDPAALLLSILYYAFYNLIIDKSKTIRRRHCPAFIQGYSKP